jgi:hypothetical protein
VGCVCFFTDFDPARLGLNRPGFCIRSSEVLRGAAKARGDTPNTSNWRPSPGSTGSTSVASTASSATSHPPSSRPSTTIEPGAISKPQYPPGPDAKDRPIHSVNISLNADHDIDLGVVQRQHRNPGAANRAMAMPTKRFRATSASGKEWRPLDQPCSDAQQHALALTSATTPGDTPTRQ